MQNFKALFREKLAKFRDDISLSILLILVSSILGVVVKQTRVADDSAIIGAEAFQVKLQMTLRTSHPALSFLQSF